MDIRKTANGYSADAVARLPRRTAVRSAVLQAQGAGFNIGQEVFVGCIPGRVVGYNIARCGCYAGDHYPLLVCTDFGVAKCRLSEVTRVCDTGLT